MFLYSFTAESNAAADIKKINSRIQGFNKYSVGATYKFYRNKDVKAPLQTMNAMIHKEGANQLFKLGDFEMIVNTKYSVAVNHDLKTIAISSTEKASVMKTPLNLDTFLHHFTSSSIIKGKAAEKGHRIELSGGEYERVDIYFDSASFQLKKFVLYSRVPMQATEGAKPEKARLEVVFNAWNLNPLFKKDEFSEAKYIKWRGGKPALSEAYQNYKFTSTL